jgi:hypothetical protein
MSHRFYCTKVLAVLAVCAALLISSQISFASGHGSKNAVKKALLLVTFGTSVPEAQGALAKVDAAL